MLTYYTKRSGGEEFRQLESPLKNGTWVNGSTLEISELDALVKQYDLSPNIVYDVRDKQELSRLEFSTSGAYVFLRVPRMANSGHVMATPMLSVVKTEAFLTFSLGETYAPETVAATTLPIDSNHTTDLLLGVIAACVNDYEELIRHTERAINETGTRLKTHEVTNADFIHFVTVEDNLITFRINLEGILAVLQRLKTTEKLPLSDENHEALDDIFQQIQQLLVAVESYGGRIENIRNAYSTIADNNLNRRMKTLTVLTVLITLPNIIYGMFGMNVGLPFAHESWAYAAVVGISVILTLIVYIFARRKLL